MREEGALFLGEGVLVLHHGLGVGAYWGGGAYSRKYDINIL